MALPRLPGPLFYRMALLQIQQLSAGCLENYTLVWSKKEETNIKDLKNTEMKFPDTERPTEKEANRATRGQRTTAQF